MKTPLVLRFSPFSFLFYAALSMSATLLINCAHHPNSDPNPDTRSISGRSCQDPEELVAILAKFATAVNTQNFHQAISYLSKQDQAKMMIGSGEIPDEIKRKLRALNFQSLATDRRIDLVHGKITGVFDCLPCMDQAAPVPVQGQGKVEWDDSPEPMAKPIQVDSQSLEKARKAMAKDFYRQIQLGKFEAAAKLVHADEWKVFLDSKGRLGDLTERRLQAMEECDLDALTLTDGKLTGIVLVLEPPVSELYLAAMRFFDLVDQNKINQAVGMLLLSEQKAFRDKNGNLLPGSIEKLKALDRGEWKRFYLSNKSLLGVAEAALGYASLNEF